MLIVYLHKSDEAAVECLKAHGERHLFGPPLLVPDFKMTAPAELQGSRDVTAVLAFKAAFDPET